MFCSDLIQFKTGSTHTCSCCAQVLLNAMLCSDGVQLKTSSSLSIYTGRRYKHTCACCAKGSSLKRDPVKYIYRQTLQTHTHVRAVRRYRCTLCLSRASQLKKLSAHDAGMSRRRVIGTSGRSWRSSGCTLGNQGSAALAEEPRSKGECKIFQLRPHSIGAWLLDLLEPLAGDCLR